MKDLILYELQLIFIPKKDRIYLKTYINPLQINFKVIGIKLYFPLSNIIITSQRMNNLYLKPNHIK